MTIKIDSDIATPDSNSGYDRDSKIGIRISTSEHDFAEDGIHRKVGNHYFMKLKCKKCGYECRSYSYDVCLIDKGRSKCK